MIFLIKCLNVNVAPVPFHNNILITLTLSTPQKWTGMRHDFYSFKTLNKVVVGKSIYLFLCSKVKFRSEAKFSSNIHESVFLVGTREQRTRGRDWTDGLVSCVVGTWEALGPI